MWQPRQNLQDTTDKINAKCCTQGCLCYLTEECAPTLVNHEREKEGVQGEREEKNKKEKNLQGFREIMEGESHACL